MLIGFDELLVLPVAPVMAPPYAATHQMSGNRSSRNNQLPKMPKFCACRLLAYARRRWAFFWGHHAMQSRKKVAERRARPCADRRLGYTEQDRTTSGDWQAIGFEVESNEIRLLRLMLRVEVKSGTAGGMDSIARWSLRLRPPHWGPGAERNGRHFRLRL